MVFNNDNPVEERTGQLGWIISIMDD